MITRREFLTASSGSLIIAAVGSHDATAAERPWYATMRRCGQLNLNERDPLTLDVAGWIDYWSSLKLDALLLNGGGIVAFYPTEVREASSSARAICSASWRLRRSHETCAWWHAWIATTRTRTR
jgi:hypothetical protein